MWSNKIFQNVEYLREAISKTKITNKTLKPYENSIDLQLRIFHFLSNAEGDYDGKKLLLRLINMVRVYKMEDVYTWMSKLSVFDEIDPKEWLVILKKADKSSSREIHSGLSRLNRAYSKIKMIYDVEEIDNIENIKKVKNILFIDDFVGTGETAKTLLLKTKNEYNKKVLTYYITQEGKTNLEDLGIEVEQRYIAYPLDDEEIETYCETKHPLSYQTKYEQKTLISQSFNSSNNNYRYLYYYNKQGGDNWKPFLYRNDTYGNHFNSMTKNKKVLDKFFESNKVLVKKLIVHGYRCKEDRYKIYTDFLNGESNIKEEVVRKEIEECLTQSSMRMSNVLKFQNNEDKKKEKWYNYK